MSQLRDEERQHDQVSQQDDAVQSEQAAPSHTRFTNQGPIPAVENGVGAHGPSASDRAFGSLTVTARGLNVRSGPSTNDRILGKLHRGDTVQELGRANGWVQISFGSAHAYVHGAYVTSGSGENEAKGHGPDAEDHAEAAQTQGSAAETAAAAKTAPGQGHAPSKEDMAEPMEWFREVNGDQGRGAPPSKENQAAAMEIFRDVNGEQGRGAPPGPEAQAEAMQIFREVNGGPASEQATAAGTAAPAQSHAPSKEKLAELVAELE